MKTVKNIDDKKKKKDEYVQKARAKYNEDKTTGNMENRNMYFLEHIIKTMGYNKMSFAKKIGLSYQMFAWWFVADDTTMSNLTMALERAGIEISVDFQKIEDGNVILNRPTYEIQGVLPMEGKTSSLNRCVANRIEEGGKLGSFAEMIRDTHVALTTFAERCKTDYNNLCRWLETDDIKISKMYNAAEAFGYKLIWKTKLIEKNKEM